MAQHDGTPTVQIVIPVHVLARLRAAADQAHRAPRNDINNGDLVWWAVNVTTHRWQQSAGLVADPAINREIEQLIHERRI